MKPHLTSVHEAMHAVGAAVFLCSIPNVAGVKVFLHISKSAEGDGECGILLPDLLRPRVDHRALNGWMAAGPLGHHLTPDDIAHAVAEGRMDDYLSDSDMEKAAHISAQDQFMAATAAHFWHSRVDTVALHKALTCPDMNLHQPLILLDAICPGRMAAAVKAEAKKLLPCFFEIQTTLRRRTNNVVPIHARR